MGEGTKIANFYIKYTEKHKRLLEQSDLRLKYNYSDKAVLAQLEMLSKISIPEYYQREEHFTDNSFLDNLYVLLQGMDNDKITNYFLGAYLSAKINRIDGLHMDDCRAGIIKDDKKITFNIDIPNIDIETDTLHAAIMHELSHFSLLLGKSRSDIYEYSEALSIFFEDMMYKAINGKAGERIFIKNRLTMLRDTYDDLEEDLFYAKNPHYLGIDSKYYEMCLASNISYPESFEYVLQLLKRRKEDHIYVDNMIGGLLFGEDSLEGAAKKLDINTSNYRETLKLIR